MSYVFNYTDSFLYENEIKNEMCEIQDTKEVIAKLSPKTFLAVIDCDGLEDPTDLYNEILAKFDICIPVENIEALSDILRTRNTDDPKLFGGLDQAYSEYILILKNLSKLLDPTEMSILINEFNIGILPELGIKDEYGISYKFNVYYTL